MMFGERANGREERQRLAPFSTEPLKTSVARKSRPKFSQSIFLQFENGIGVDLPLSVELIARRRESFQIAVRRGRPGNFLDPKIKRV